MSDDEIQLPINPLHDPAWVRTLQHAPQNDSDPHYYILYDKKGNQFVTPSPHVPLREQLIEGMMLVPHFRCYKNAEGAAIKDGPYFLARAEAEAKIDTLYPHYTRAPSP